LIERLPEFLSLIVAIRHFSEARGEPSVAERPVGPFHKILSTIVVFEALIGGLKAGQFTTSLLSPVVSPFENRFGGEASNLCRMATHRADGRAMHDFALQIRRCPWGFDRRHSAGRRAVVGDSPI
jgi:hypothetical protein